MYIKLKVNLYRLDAHEAMGNWRYICGGQKIAVVNKRNNLKKHTVMPQIKKKITENAMHSQIPLYTPEF